MQHDFSACRRKVLHVEEDGYPRPINGLHISVAHPFIFRSLQPANEFNRVQEGMIFVTMDKDDLAPACRYPFRLENHDDDEDDDEDNDPEESDDDELNDLEFPLLEPCEHSPSAYRGSPANFFELDRTEPGPQAGETHMEPSARFKIRREDRGNKVKATLTFEPAL